MDKQEFNLSEEIFFYSKNKVKEFIRRLKEFVEKNERHNQIDADIVLEEIDKLAGEELVE